MRQAIKEQEILKGLHKQIEGYSKKNQIDNNTNNNTKIGLIGMKRNSNFKCKLLSINQIYKAIPVQSFSDPSTFSPKTLRVSKDYRRIEDSTKQQWYNYSKLALKTKSKQSPFKNSQTSNDSKLKMYLSWVQEEWNANVEKERQPTSSIKYYHFSKNKQKV